MNWKENEIGAFEKGGFFLFYKNKRRKIHWNISIPPTLVGKTAKNIVPFYPKPDEQPNYFIIGKLEVDGVVYGKDWKPKSPTPKTTNSGSNKNHQNQAHRSTTYPAKNVTLARSPYNFVSLDPSGQITLAQQPLPPLDRYQLGENFHTGWLVLTLTNKTPLYIRREKDDAASFTVDGTPIIPGSTIRGMTRTLFEIITRSRFNTELVDHKKKLFYRNFRDKNYRDQFIYKGEGNDVLQKVRAGWIKKKRGKQAYRLRELTPNTLKNGAQFYRVNGTTRHVPSGRFELDRNGSHISTLPFRKKTVFFNPDNDQEVYKQFFYPSRQKFRLHYHILKEVSERNQAHLEEGVLWATGPLARKKHHQYVFPLPATAKPEVIFPIELIEGYEEDVNRKDDYNLVKEMTENEEEWYPCFFLTDGDENILSFGHTPNYRLQYLKSIGDHIPNSHFQQKGLDFTEGVFGNTADQATRVYFEDAYPLQKIQLHPVRTLQQLQSPKPTTFQHYLNQNNPNSPNDTWNEDTSIRGYKLYWHRKTQDKQRENDASSWSSPKPGPERIQQFPTPVQVIPADNSFQTRVRFENLTSAELGALLFVLDFEHPNLCHKIGMAKPLGLGSIQINAELNLCQVREKYGKLFETAKTDYSWSNGIPVEDTSVEEKEKIKMKFISYVYPNFKGSTSKELWNAETRFKELRTLLDLSHTKSNDLEDWNERTRYMSIDNKEFQKRPILGFPDEVAEPRSKFIQPESRQQGGRNQNRNRRY